MLFVNKENILIIGTWNITELAKAAIPALIRSHLIRRIIRCIAY